MKLKKHIGNLVACTIPSIIILSGMIGFNFYKNHNLDWKENGKRILEKADGIYSTTKLTLNEDGSRKINTDEFPLILSGYTDKDNDNLVDEIYHSANLFVRGSKSQTLFCYPHFYRNKICRDADEAFQKEMKRFGNPSYEK